MLTLRPAQPSDTPLIVAYLHELAAFERLPHECHANDMAVRDSLFSANPKAYALMAEWEGQPAGCAVYFYNFSTFLAMAGIYVEDIYIRPDYRRKGIAREIFRYLAAKAVAEGCGRLEWSVLDWNENAIALYRSLGAMPVEGWTVQRMTGAALEALVKQKEPVA
jgi:GNAT superfamily N-acetyltransferase